jgi:hypothetical protein
MTSTSKYMGNGCAEAVRLALRHGPATLDGLCARMPRDKYSRKQIRYCVGQLVWSCKGVISNGLHPVTYSLGHATPRPENPDVLRPLQVEFKPLARDPFEHMQLAMLTRARA